MNYADAIVTCGAAYTRSNYVASPKLPHACSRCSLRLKSCCNPWRVNWIAVLPHLMSNRRALFQFVLFDVYAEQRRIVAKFVAPKAWEH